MRPILCVAGLVLAAWLPLAAAERTPLVAIDYDTIRLVSGNDLMGTIESTDADGTLRVRTLRQGLVAVVKDQVRQVEPRRSLAQSVAARGAEALAAGDANDLLRTLRFVIERQREPAKDPKVAADLAAALEAALALAAKAQAARPSSDVAALVLPLLFERKDLERAQAQAEAGLKGDPSWSDGWRALARVQREKGDAEGQRRVAVEWLRRQPTALEANQVLARSAEQQGDWKTAQEAWRKGFDLHKDQESALGLARAATNRGEHAEAVRGARALIAAGSHVPEANAWLGAALLAQGDEAGAAAALEAANAAADLPEAAAEVVRYDLALLRLRAGRNDDAARLLRQVRHPAAQLALARIEGRPWQAPADAPAALKALAAERNALAGLAEGRAEAVQGLDLRGDARHIRIGRYAQVLRTSGAEEAVRALAAADASPEALRWQAYGHLLAGRLPQAEAVLDRLPGNDGWAIAARVHIAAARKDEPAARSWYARLAASDQPPRAYVARLAAEFASALDEELKESFDWADAEPPPGWQVSGPGTAIAARALQGRLVLSGTQADEVPTRVWRLVPAARLRAAQVLVDASQAAGADLWLEVVDDATRAGWAVGLVGGRLQARPLGGGQAGSWQPLDAAVPASGPVLLRLEVDKGVFSTGPADDPARRMRLGAVAGAGSSWAVALAGQARRGTAWSGSFDDLLIQLRPAPARR
ncbi:MAG: hypothetical protein L6R48_09300 [Planctomycetes bacterium]|nr:hypothetical protein [Planctomycetota bacterium]